MQQDTTLMGEGGGRAEPLSREILSVEIREGRDLLPVERMTAAEPYVVVTVFDSSGRAVGSHKTTVVSGSINPYWMQRFDFHVTQWDKEGGYVEIALYDNLDRQGDRLGYIRQPLFRLSETGAMEGWYYMDRALHPSAALYFRITIQPYQSMAGTGAATAGGLASGVSARQPPAAAGIGLSGLGSRTPLGPTVAGTQGTVMAEGAGPVLAREGGVNQLYFLRSRFWGLSNTYEVKDAQGLLHYRLIGNFGGKLDDIRISDPSGHEVGFIREDASFLSRLNLIPTFLISVYGTTATLKKKFLSFNQPIFSLRPFNAQSIHIKGNLANYEYSFYQATTILADVSKALAPAGEVGLYGVRVAPATNPLMILAAVVAIDRINDLTGMRGVSNVYGESKSSLMSRMKRGKKDQPVVLSTTTVTPAATTTTGAVPVVSAPIAVTRSSDLGTTTSRVYATPAPLPAPPVPPAPPAAVQAAPQLMTGIPTTPVVSVSTVPQREELAVTERLRQEEMQEKQMMQAERVEMAPPAMAPAVEAQQTVMQQQQPREVMEKDDQMSEDELRRAQPVRIPIMGAGGID